MRFLIAEDEQALRMFLARGMESEGHDVVLACDGEDVLEKVEQQTPDIVILDLNLPKRDGTEVLRAIRAYRDDLPVIVLTSRADLETRICCFDLGADDFMPKPFSLRELRARCRALLRRKGVSSPQLRCGGLQLNRADHTAVRDGEVISLTKKEFSLLECLMAHRGQCVSRSALLEQVWKTSGDANTNVVDVYINYLRRKLGDSRESSLIQTVRGVGYAIRTAGPERKVVSSSDSAQASPNAPSALNLAAWEIYGNSFGSEQHLGRVAG